MAPEHSTGNPLPTEIGGVGRWDREGFYSPGRIGFGFLELDDGEVMVCMGGRRLSAIPEALVARPTEERVRPRQLSAAQYPIEQGQQGEQS